MVKPTPTSCACGCPPCFALRRGLPRALGPVYKCAQVTRCKGSGKCQHRCKFIHPARGSHWSWQGCFLCLARFAHLAAPLPRENTDVRQRRFRAHSSSCSHLEVWRFTGKQFVHRVQRHVSIYYHRFGCFNQVGLSVTLSGIQAAAAKIHRGPPSPQLHLSCVSRPCHRCKT